MRRIPLYGTRITARGSSDWSPKQSYLFLSSPMASYQAHSPTFESRSKLAACSFLSCSPRSCSLSLPKGSVQMKSPHPCLGMITENRMARKHLVENHAMAPSLSQLMEKVQILSMRLSSRRRTENEKHCLRRDFKRREIGLRMVPLLEFHAILPVIPKYTGLRQTRCLLANAFPSLHFRHGTNL